MSIVVAHGARSDLPPIQMSNGLTSVFVSVLALAASSLAQSGREREMAVWLASHDQGIFGRGAVDFDVCDYPWDRRTFDQDKSFLLSVIRAASSQHEWSKLGYSPRAEWVLECLSKFEHLVQIFFPDHMIPAEEQKWFGERPSKYELCPTHGVYLHSHGCVICNDA